MERRFEAWLRTRHLLQARLEHCIRDSLTLDDATNEPDRADRKRRLHLSVDVEVMNACLLPIVLGFLLALERKALPPEFRMHGAHRA